MDFQRDEDAIIRDTIDGAECVYYLTAEDRVVMTKTLIVQP